jgi:hypothetical protein
VRWVPSATQIDEREQASQIATSISMSPAANGPKGAGTFISTTGLLIRFQRCLLRTPHLGQVKLPAWNFGETNPRLKDDAIHKRVQKGCAPVREYEPRPMFRLERSSLSMATIVSSVVVIENPRWNQQPQQPDFPRFVKVS